jgi:hypothetical protein
MAGIALASCEKQVDCGCNPSAVETSSIFGTWILTSKGSYVVPFRPTNWEGVPANRAAYITIGHDSSVAVRNLVEPYLPSGFDRIRKEDGYLVLYSSSGSAVFPRVSVQKTGSNEIIVTRHWTDTGDQEEYKRECR